MIIYKLFLVVGVGKKEIGVIKQSMGRVWQWPYDTGSSVDSVLVENLQH